MGKSGGGTAKDGGNGGDVEGEKTPEVERSHGVWWWCLLSLFFAVVFIVGLDHRGIFGIL